MSDFRNYSVGCVVLNYNDSSTTINLLKQIQQYNSIKRIVVVDNLSTDDSFSRLLNMQKGNIDVIQTDHNGGYDIFLIPHVEEDFKACKDFNLLYPETKLVKPFDNPMDVKSFISGMDIFIGARMHATIGAFTSGVVTIPTAYSRKFETMFSVVEYNTIVDLQKLNTKEALERTMLYICQ